MKNCIQVHEYSTHRFIFGLFLKVNKICGASMKPSELLCFKDIQFYNIVFLSGRQ